MSEWLRGIGIFSIVLFAVCGCVYKGGTLKTAGEKPVLQPAPPHFLSPAELIDSNLEIVWQSELPMQQGETLDKLFIVGDRIYSLSSRNFLTAFDRKNGLIAFGRELAKPGFPVTGFDQYNNEFFTIEGDTLLEMNPKSGKDVTATPLSFTAACPAVRNSSFFYIAGTDGRIRALRAADKVEVFEVAAEDDSAFTSLVADENFVIFTTDSGLCVGFSPNAPKYLWKFKAQGGIVGPAVKNAESIFFASKDTYVYRLEAATGKFVWQCPMGAILEQGPDVTGKCVYQYSRERGLTAVDRAGGRILWRLSEGLKLLAEAGGKTYVASSTDGIRMVDKAHNNKVSVISIPSVSKYAANATDSKIYVADNSGRIACLKPMLK